MSFIPEQKGFLGRIASSVQRAIVPPPDPKEVVQKWSRQIRSETRVVERSVRGVPLTIFNHGHLTVLGTLVSCPLLPDWHDMYLSWFISIPHFFLFMDV
jgi:hypothetical protein